jgi:hypothetical protein
LRHQASGAADFQLINRIKRSRFAGPFHLRSNGPYQDFLDSMEPAYEKQRERQDAVRVNTKVPQQSQRGEEPKNAASNCLIRK